MKTSNPISEPWINGFHMVSSMQKITKLSILLTATTVIATHTACSTAPQLMAPDAPTIREVMQCRQDGIDTRKTPLLKHCYKKEHSTISKEKGTNQYPKYQKANAIKLQAGPEKSSDDADARTRQERPINDGVGDLHDLLQAHHARLQKYFNFLPNPTLPMYIYAHRSTAGNPVPGYLTYFKLYRCDQAALQNEIHEQSKKAVNKKTHAPVTKTPEQDLSL